MPTMIVRPRIGTFHLALSWVSTLISAGYMLPWAVAATRQRPNTVSIGVLTFLLGWTIIGWIWMLVLACSSRPHRVEYIYPEPGGRLYTT